MIKLNKKIKKEKLYYATLSKIDYTLYIATTKTGIARKLGISHDTVSRYLKDPMKYSNKNYIIWKDVHINKGTRKSKPLKWH